MTFHQFLLALNAHKKLFAFIVLATLLVAIVVSLLMPRTYVARSSVLVDKKQELGFIETQVDIIRSSKVAQKVVRDLKLDQDPAAKAAFERDTGGAGSIQDWLVEGMLKKLHVDWSQSAVIDIKYFSSSPKLAADVANAFARDYVNTVQELAVEPARESLAWFDDQLKQLRSNLDQAQQKLAAFQKERGFVSTAPDDRYDIESARLADLSTQLLAAQNQVQDATVRQQQARAALASGTGADVLPEVATNSFIQSLRGQILAGEAQLQQMRAELGPNHPQLKAELAQLQSLRQRLQAETEKAVGGLGAITRQAREREAELRNALSAQRTRVLQIKQSRNDAEVLQRDVAQARQAYENAYERSMVNRVQTRATQPQVSVLNAAVVPLLPYSPRIGLNLGLALAVGLMLAIALVYLLEAGDRRVRSRVEFEAYVPVPLLGELHRWQSEGGRLIEGAPSRLLPGPA